jgi:peptidoglycan/LPS O-acetylase OafA/YrhL
LTTTTPKNHSYYPALDGLRGIAIIVVVLFHNFGFLEYFVFGWLGVDLFFVLSGFLITNILLNTVGKRHYLKNFYVRRVLRIFPLYYSVLILTIFVFSQIPSLKSTFQYYFNNQIWFWLFVENWLFALTPLERTNFLNHFWSLAVEEQFYLLWPIVILLVRKLKVLLVLMGTLLIFILIVRIVVWEHHIETVHYMSLYTFTRIDGICIGSMLALIIKIDVHVLRAYSAFIALLLSIANFTFFFLNRMRGFSFPFFPFLGYTTCAAIFAIVVYEAVIGETGIVNRILNTTILKFFGKVSFGFYVFHWPTYISLNSKFIHLLRIELDAPVAISRFLSSVACTLIGFVLSVLSCYFFESKFLKLKTRYH